MNEDYKPRFSFEISEELHKRTSVLLSTYGLKKTIFSVVLEDLLNLIEEHGNVVIGILLDGAVKPREIMPILNKAERKANGIT